MKKILIIPILLLAAVLRFNDFLSLFSFLGSLIIIFTLFLLTAKVKKDFLFALLFSLLLGVNPWFIVLSRELQSLSVNFSFSFVGFSEYLSRYLASFSGRFLFFNGDWPEFIGKAMGSQGALYLADLFFLFIGFGFLIAKKRDWLDNSMLFLLVLAPLPSVVFPRSGLIISSSLLIIPLLFTASLGLKESLNFINKSRGKVYPWVLITIFLIYGFLFVRFWDLYLFH